MEEQVKHVRPALRSPVGAELPAAESGKARKIKKAPATEREEAIDDHQSGADSGGR